MVSTAVRRWALALLLAAFAAAGLWWSAEDPVYLLQETLQRQRYRAQDDLIAATALRHQVDPLLVKAVIWQESRFKPDMAGTSGERGLMQVTEPAAQDWARATDRRDFEPQRLFDPATNIEVGTWYLAQAIRHWQDRDDPLPFALAEYNAGRSRVKRWSAGQAAATADEMRQAMDFPTTRAYIAAVLNRYHFYKNRGDNLGDAP